MPSTSTARTRGASSTAPFTLALLREVHEAVLGERLLRDNFWRRMEPMLRPVEGTAMPAGVGRPALLFVVDDQKRGIPQQQSRVDMCCPGASVVAADCGSRSGEELLSHGRMAR